MLRLILFFVCFLGCYSINAQYPFQPIPPVSKTPELLIPTECTYHILFSEGDTVYTTEGLKAPAKGNHDYIALLSTPDSSKKILYIGHETNSKSDELGDGGGASLVPITFNGSSWTLEGKKLSVDFSTVGGTYDNCGGAVTASSTIITSEEFPPSNNSLLYNKGKGFRDTSMINGLKRFENMGWMVEIDPVSRKALRKLYKMGRYSHEGIYIMPDQKTVYLTDDFLPSVFFKFVANEKNQFSDGQLYAYRQGVSDGKSLWIPLPMDMNSLINIRSIAIQLGATLFVRMEWITAVNGLLYLTETGSDDFSLDEFVRRGGFPANHLSNYKTSLGYDYPYGSVLVFDPVSDLIKPYIKGGQGVKDSTIHFSNPDAITSLSKGGKHYLVISEDIIGVNKHRTVLNKGSHSNEVWWIDTSIEHPTPDDLKRFMVAPNGAETTGGCFSEDGTSFFINIQHPDKKNPTVFNKSTTVVITGFK